ncbi:hypothetical protein LV164_003321 [Aspergillus fumigatus]|nr:hypothetical protein KXV32_001002 [Aspergillus fumigatus]KAH3190236.1 hypothetical protein KXV92_003673 [Aspergillus fumigatus]KAJ8194762.1 hypothetical protein LV157_002482 [Aspergillus fumigatus]KAJ8210518.1 hypothetical protein LV164_003321 [Aspergillus fumigatus]KEY81226.1 cyanamide hydratase [Aspergillus fumigatus]
MCQNEVEVNGWTSMPANAGAIFDGRPFINVPEALSVEEIKFPVDDPIVEKTMRYAKAALPTETFNHSMRVYYYGMQDCASHGVLINRSQALGMAITKQQFPKQASALSPSTWALTCLLHDIGTSDHNLAATRMSFDIYGGIKALEVLKGFGATSDQAEAVAEAIIRHQDLGVHGTITYIGQLIQLATIYDNVGAHPYVKDFGELIHDTTRSQVHEAHPPGEWRTFFSGVIQKEQAIKPWCHTKKMVNVLRKGSQHPDGQ